MSLPNIGLIGKKRTGKDTLADWLVEMLDYQRLPFAGPLRGLLEYVNPLVGQYPDGLSMSYNEALLEFGYEGAKDALPEFRRSLADTGTGIREMIHNDIWVDLWDDSFSSMGGPIVVTDCRFPNEAEILSSRDFVLVRIVRPGLVEDTAGQHISETALDDWPTHYTIVNDGSVFDLHDEIATIISREIFRRTARFI